MPPQPNLTRRQLTLRGALGLPFFTGACAFMIPNADTPEIARSHAEKAFIWGLPLVLMEQTRQSGQAAQAARSGLPPMANTFTHARNLVPAQARVVVRPNNDTLYSSAWLDLSRGPVRLDVPAISRRYWIVPFMDAWTNVFATVGSRTHAAEVAERGGTWWIAGSVGRDQIPPGAQVFIAPTDLVWIIGRIELRGPADLPAVRSLQDGFKLSPARDALGIPSAPSRRLPPQIMRDLSAQVFFDRLAALLAKQSALPQDTLPLALLKAMGVTPGQAFDPAKAGRSQAWIDALEQGKRDAYARLAEAGLSRRDPAALSTSNGWNLNNMAGMGNFGSDYGLRAAIALSGLGALPLADAWYPATDFDSRGQRLSGEHRYRLVFDQKRLPPANAFWSITLYDADGYFVDNAEHRYALTDRDPLRFNSDGSLTLFVGNTPPAETEWRNNWLPAPAGPFNLTMRLYDPHTQAFAGGWIPPAVVRE